MAKPPTGKPPPPHLLEQLQARYAQAVSERGDLPADIMEKFGRFQLLAAKAKAGNLKPKAAREADALAIELAPHFHFKADDIDWTKQ